MRNGLIGGLAMGASVILATPGYACPTWHMLSNGTTADATQVMDNFNSTLQCPNFTGKVGIGTSSPDSRMLLTLDNANNYGGIAFRIGGTLIGDIEQEGTGNMYYDTLGDIWLRPGNVVSMDLQANGRVGIGTTAPSYTLHVNGSVAGTSAYNNLSDRRLKKDVVPIADALSMIDKLRGVRFTWRTPEERTVGRMLSLPSDKPQIGFIAQEILEVLPEAITVADGKDAILSMQESKIVPLLVEALKELKAKDEQETAAETAAIAKLQREIAELRGEHRDVAANETVLHRMALAFGFR
jgi:hypothetical protein